MNRYQNIQIIRNENEFVGTIGDQYYRTVYYPEIEPQETDIYIETEFVGVVDGTEPEEVEMYDGVCMKLYMYDKNANGVMDDVFKALSMNHLYSCSINIKLKDGRNLTINHEFPNTQRTCGWKPEYVDFARKFVMV